MHTDSKKHETPTDANNVLAGVLHECSFCHNTYTLEEGFRIDTNQCKGCQQYDDERPARDKEIKELMEWKKNNPVDFPYVAGDPFW